MMPLNSKTSGVRSTLVEIRRPHFSARPRPTTCLYIETSSIIGCRGQHFWYSTSSKPSRSIARCLHWLMPPILWVFSATHVRTMRGRVGGCRSFVSAFRRNCAANSAGRRGISDYGKTRSQLRRFGPLCGPQVGHLTRSEKCH